MNTPPRRWRWVRFTAMGSAGGVFYGAVQFALGEGATIFMLCVAFGAVLGLIVDVLRGLVKIIHS